MHPQYCRTVGDLECRAEKRTPTKELQSTQFTGGGNGDPGRMEMHFFNTTKVVDVGVKVGGAVQESQCLAGVWTYVKVHLGLTFFRT